MKIFIEASVLLLAYIFGSIPFGLLIVKLTTGKDIRTLQRAHRRDERGTGRGCRRRSAEALMDALKGACSRLVAQAVSPNNHWLHVLAPIAAILGHIIQSSSPNATPMTDSAARRSRGGRRGGAFGLWWPSVFIVVPLGHLSSWHRICIHNHHEHRFVITAIFSVYTDTACARRPARLWQPCRMLHMECWPSPYCCGTTSQYQGTDRGARTISRWRPWQKTGPKAPSSEELAQDNRRPKERRPGGARQRENV